LSAIGSQRQRSLATAAAGPAAASFSGIRHPANQLFRLLAAAAAAAVSGAASCCYL